MNSTVVDEALRPDDGGFAAAGRVRSIHIAERGSVEMQTLAEARLIAGVGIEGDRYATGAGTYSDKVGPDRQLTLIEWETLLALERDFGIRLAPDQTRRNIVTSETPLAHLVGREFMLGGARLRGVRINQPCKHLENLLGLGLVGPLLNRSGLNAEVLEGGTVRVGDAIRPLGRGEVRR